MRKNSARQMVMFNLAHAREVALPEPPRYVLLPEGRLPVPARQSPRQCFSRRCSVRSWPSAKLARMLPLQKLQNSVSRPPAPDSSRPVRESVPTLR